MCSRLGAGFTPGKTMRVLTPKGTAFGNWGFRRGSNFVYNARMESLSTVWKAENHNRGLIEVASFWEKDKEFKALDGKFLKIGVIYNKDGDFLVVTTPSNADVRPFHQRMPAIFVEEDAEAFLKGQLNFREVHLKVA